MITSAMLVSMIVACGFVCLPDVASGGEWPVGKTAVADTAGGQCEFSDAPGKVLVQKLMDTNSCSVAFYELWRRSERDKDAGYASFLKDHYDPKVILCPQGNGKSPIYVVLYGFLSRETCSSQDDYEIPNQAELFPLSGGKRRDHSWDMGAIEVFTSDGKRIEPFDGDDCLQESGIMADINGDGFVERADHVSYSVGGIKEVNVLDVSVVTPQPQIVLSVLYNWGEDEWAYKFSDPDNDGILDVELGPKVPEGIKTKLVYKWDKDKKAYSGPAGKDGDHFRLLDVDVSQSFERLKKDKLTFPKDPDFVDERTMMDDPWAKLGQKRPSPKDLSKPYRYVSLKGLSHEDVVRYMGEGKSVSDLEWDNVIKTHVPKDFWSLGPKSAAFATADVNRYPVHQNRFRLAVDDRDGQMPPDTCSISFTYVSDRSYNAVDCHYFLRVDPKRSYLAYARSWAGGIVFYNVIHDQPAFDFRFCEITYEEARHIAHVIWWLNRVRSLSVASLEGVGFMSTSADGTGSLCFRKDGGDVAFKIDGTMWPGHISERWRAGYNREVCLNLASYLISVVVTDHLGDRWSRFEPKHAQNVLARQNRAPQYELDEMKNIQELSEIFLDLFSLEQASISFAIVSESARAAGGFVFTNLSAKLGDIQSRLPTVRTPKRSKEEIEAEIKQLETVKPGCKGWENAMQKSEVLQDELMALYRDTGADDVEALRESLSLSLKKLQSKDDPQTLQDWAISKEPGCQWALQRLKAKDRKRYVAALEWWMKNTNEKWARQAFAAIAKEDSENAVEIAKGVRPGEKGDLTVSAFAHLSEVDGIPDEQKRVKALIKVVLEPKSGWEERGRAIGLLVPSDQPLRYPTRDIDEALVKLFNPKMADDVVNFTLLSACRGLARRGRVEYFGKMTAALRTSEGMMYGEVLGPLTQLVQCEPAKYSPRLQAILQPQLKQTNKMMTDILMAVWSADLRGLAPDLERIATSCPDDYEDNRAHSCGGEVRAVEGRFHLARKILSLWNEEDQMVRCKLLLAFGFNNAYEYVGDPVPERLARIKIELSKITQVLTQAQRKEVLAFLQWYEGEHINKEVDEVSRDRRAKFDALVRDALKLH